MTQVGYGGLVRIDGPLPQKRFSRLLDVATLVPTVDERWLSGVHVMPYPDDTGHVHDACATGSTATKATGTLPDLPIFGAFTAYVPVECTSFSIGDVATWFRERALAALLAVESTIAERVFVKAEGMDSTEPHLTDGSLVQLNGGAAVSAKEALDLLEDAIGATGRAGVIHAAPATVSEWESLGFTLDKSGSNLVTRSAQTPVVNGAGYRGVHPDGGGAPGAKQEWAFATGPVQYRQTEAFITPDTYAQALDRAVNSFTAYAERHMLVDWDGVLQAGVLVDRSL